MRARELFRRGLGAGPAGRRALVHRPVRAPARLSTARARGWPGAARSRWGASHGMETPHVAHLRGRGAQGQGVPAARRRGRPRRARRAPAARDEPARLRRPPRLDPRHGHPPRERRRRDEAGRRRRGPGRHGVPAVPVPPPPGHEPGVAALPAPDPRPASTRPRRTRRRAAAHGTAPARAPSHHARTPPATPTAPQPVHPAFWPRAELVARVRGGRPTLPGPPRHRAGRLRAAVVVVRRVQPRGNRAAQLVRTRSTRSAGPRRRDGQTRHAASRTPGPRPQSAWPTSTGSLTSVTPNASRHPVAHLTRQGRHVGCRRAAPVGHGQGVLGRQRRRARAARSPWGTRPARSARRRWS